MVIRAFPPVETADEHGLLAVGGDLEVPSLVLAYKSGIFPWPISEEHLTWFSPAMRCLLFFDDFHVSRSLRKFARTSGFHCEIDRSFPEIVHHCSTSENRAGQKGTWITREVEEAYIDFHAAGYAHCVGCYDRDRLIGGIYGVSVGGMFAGESMFFLEPNASKLALWYLVEHLREQGVTWMDCQVENSFSAGFGAKEIPRAEYMVLLGEALRKPPLNWTQSSSAVSDSD